MGISSQICKFCKHTASACKPLLKAWQAWVIHRRLLLIHFESISINVWISEVDNTFRSHKCGKHYLDSSPFSTALQHFSHIRFTHMVCTNQHAISSNIVTISVKIKRRHVGCSRRSPTWITCFPLSWQHLASSLVLLHRSNERHSTDVGELSRISFLTTVRNVEIVSKQF